MTFTDSDVYTVTTGQLLGVVIADPSSPGSGHTYLYGNIGRAETLTVGAYGTRYLTQPKQEFSFSDNEDNTVSLNILIPFSDTHDLDVQAMRNFVRRRKVLLYRDNRGRLLYGVLLNVDIADAPEGTYVSGTLNVSDYASV